ncbi:organomercurial lyase [Blastococcus capsensis]|uniref:organomercurial lyase n=1 Tax=Blastococcus capsensis TaxID=1564163 RepID=UPI002541F8B0|nr:organomercurial lyase [Blastococcus capsensis]MDK3256983.1 organomercurial lyase [Blastococcus capsensis]
MSPADIALRNETYQAFVALGRSPSAEEVAVVMRMTAAEVRAGWRRLHEDHALVLNAGGTEIRMANPFSAVPSAYRVWATDRWWYANCAWDAFGICAALRSDGRIETSCADCGEPVKVAVEDEHPDEPSLLFHCLVPAHRWWDDIVFT